MSRFKQPVTLIVEHNDLADMLTDILCSWDPFAPLHVTFISEKAGQFHISLAPKPKPVPAVKKRA